MTFVQKFTDIDLKILKRAAEQNSSMTEASQQNIDAFHQDMGALGILRPDRTPRATQCLDGIRELFWIKTSDGLRRQFCELIWLKATNCIRSKSCNVFRGCSPGANPPGRVRVVVVANSTT